MISGDSAAAAAIAQPIAEMEENRKHNEGCKGNIDEVPGFLAGGAPRLRAELLAGGGACLAFPEVEEEEEGWLFSSTSLGGAERERVQRRDIEIEIESDSTPHHIQAASKVVLLFPKVVYYMKFPI